MAATDGSGRAHTKGGAVRAGRVFGPHGSCRRGVGVLLFAAVLTSGLLPGAVSASEPSGEDNDQAAAVREGQRWGAGNEGMALWFWPEGNRVYQIAASSDTYGGLKAYAADTMAEVAFQQLIPEVWGGLGSPDELVSGMGRHHVAAVDRTGGRVFVAYRRPPSVDPDARCMSTSIPDVAGCVEGVHVLEGATLAPLGRIRLDLSTLEGVRVHPTLKALTYAPAIPELGLGGRLIMVVEEVATGPLESSVAPSLSSQVQNATPRRSGGNVAYAVALDPESMRQEWAVRLEGCRNSREARNWLRAPEGHPTAVFRAGGERPALYVGCHGNPAQQGVVVRVPLDANGFPAPLPVRVGDPGEVDPDGGVAGVSGLAGLAARQEVFAGPDRVTVVLADPVSRRVLMRVDDSGQVWWVFDGHANQFVGTIGVGNYDLGHTTYGLDPDTGRLYVLAARPLPEERSRWTGPGGLYVADMRRSPLPQALVYEHLADTARDGSGPNTGGAGGGNTGRTMSVQPRADGTATRIFQTKEKGDGKLFRLLVDASPVSADPLPDGGVVRTLDVDEAVGVTQATFDGTARGFGFRTILIGGAEGVARVGPADPVGVARGVPQFESRYAVERDRVNSVPALLPRPDACGDAQRELVVAFVGPRGPAVVDASSARGQTQPVLVDVRTSQDVGAPVTRCLPVGWQALWEKGLFGRPPVEEPGVVWPFDDAASSCTATDEPQADSWADPVVGAFSSRVDCSEDEASGWGQARGIGVDGVSVAEALSSFRIYRDTARGMVARVESVARGIDIGGVVKIGMVRGSAESWANGRTPAETDETVNLDVWNPFNCDTSRPAGTCFQRHIFGVSAAGPDGKRYGCGPCGDEAALIEGLNRAFGAYANARFREPDRELARGSADGYVAAVTKKPQERFADIVMNNDLLETMVPMLEVIRYAPHNRPSDQGKNTPFEMGVPPRGRQVYQFAAVEVSSTYGIQCLLVYDAATNTCAAAKETPGSIAVTLADPDGKPLAGGAFELRSDVDADGVVGLVDALVAGGACVTAADGVGTCTFEGLAPGGYLLSQTAAPVGYGKADEPFTIDLASGEARTVAFTNAPNVSVVEVTATDEAGAPVAGAAFAVYPDPDADGKVAPDAQPAATCTTGADGACSMPVPAGSYVLVQTSAPGGLEPIEPVAFTFASGGQTAAVGIVNYPAEGEGVSPPAPVAAPIYSDPVTAAPPVQTVVAYTPLAPTEQARQPRVSLPDHVGGTIVRLIRAPGDTLRLFVRDPRQAVAFTAALALLALALLAVRRRQLLGGLTAIPAFAFTGGGTPPAAPPRPRGPSGDAGPSSGSGSSSPSGSSGPSDSPGGTVPSDGSGPSRPSRGGPALGVDGETAAASVSMSATAVLDAPVAAGAAQSPAAGPVLAVAAVTAFAPLASVVRGRLATEASCDLVAIVESLTELRTLLADSRPDVLIVDLSLPTGRSEDICDLLPGLHPPERTVGLIVPRRSVDALITRGYKAGLGALLDADEDLTNGELGYAVRTVARGRVFYGPAVQSIMADRWPSQPSRRDSAVAGLTEREIEVAMLAATGMRRAEIAERLFLAPDTVKGKLRSIRAKLGVTNPWDHDLLRRRLEEIGIAGPELDPPTDSGPAELL